MAKVYGQRDVSLCWETELVGPKLTKGDTYSEYMQPDGAFEGKVTGEICYQFL